jgi:hypothetical protein
MGLRVETEKIEAQDVTPQYTGQEANLHNLKAEEQQYLLILKQAKTVKDHARCEREAERSAWPH